MRAYPGSPVTQPSPGLVCILLPQPMAPCVLHRYIMGRSSSSCVWASIAIFKCAARAEQRSTNREAPVRTPRRANDALPRQHEALVPQLFEPWDLALAFLARARVGGENITSNARPGLGHNHCGLRPGV